MGLTSSIFGGNQMISTMNPNQQMSFNSLMNDYQRQVNRGPQADTEAVNRYLNSTINPEIRRNYDDAMNQAKANMGAGFWGSEKLSALARLQQQKNDALDTARATAMETERQNAQTRYDNARAGLAGLVNMQTQAQQYKPGLFDYANQTVGTVGNSVALYKGMKEQ